MLTVQLLCRGENRAFRNQYSLPPMWVLEIKLGLIIIRFAANTFAH